MVGGSAGGGYFQPLARTIVKTLPDWQVWSVERRENFLEDQSELNLLKQGKVSAQDAFNYYLGYLSNSSISPHYQPVQTSQVPFARDWGMNTQVNDLRVVVKAAARKGRTVAMGLIGLRIVSADGSALREPTALLRTFLLPLSTVPFGAGFLVILFDRYRRPLHDRLARTAVVYDWGSRTARMPSPLGDFLNRSR